MVYTMAQQRLIGKGDKISVVDHAFERGQVVGF